MTHDQFLEAIRDIIQEDVGNRGLRTVPGDNLITASTEDFANACRSLAEAADPAVGIVTGFFIPDAEPPCGETDGPLGAVFLARALAPLGMRVVLLTDAFCVPALSAGLGLAGLRKTVPLVTLPHPAEFRLTPEAYRLEVLSRAGRLTHLIAIERVGPSHTPESLQNQPGSTAESVQRFLARRPGRHPRPLPHHARPGHQRQDEPRPSAVRRRSRPGHHRHRRRRQRDRHGQDSLADHRGATSRAAGRSPAASPRITSSSAASATGAATAWRPACGCSRASRRTADLLDIEQERSLLEIMVQRGPLVDGVSGQETATVDGLSFRALRPAAAADRRAVQPGRR